MNPERELKSFIGWTVGVVSLLTLICFARCACIEDWSVAKITAEYPDTIEFQGEEGARWIVGRTPGETDAEFSARASRVFQGQERSAGQLCWESDCTSPPGHVKICVQCGASEPPEDCQARLDSLVAAWCATHDCEECP